MSSYMLEGGSTDVNLGLFELHPPINFPLLKKVDFLLILRGGKGLMFELEPFVHGTS